MIPPPFSETDYKLGQSEKPSLLGLLDWSRDLHPSHAGPIRALHWDYWLWDLKWWGSVHPAGGDAGKSKIKPSQKLCVRGWTESLTNMHTRAETRDSPGSIVFQDPTNSMSSCISSPARFHTPYTHILLSALSRMRPVFITCHQKSLRRVVVKHMGSETRCTGLNPSCSSY